MLLRDTRRIMLRCRGSAMLSPLVGLLLLHSPCFAQDTVSTAHNKVWSATNIIGSKHDLSGLNHRAGIEAMGGIAFSDYGDACVYCHIPEDRAGEKTRDGQIPGWNRLGSNLDEYTFYNSATMDASRGKPGDISLLCLSCHDGTTAVDRVIFRPTGWSSEEDYALHMKISASNDIQSCGKCHDGYVAHDISRKALGNNLSDDHPIAIRYLGLSDNPTGFKVPDSASGFANGIRLYEGNIECATCHDVHQPDSYKLLRTDTETLCITCHTN